MSNSDSKQKKQKNKKQKKKTGGHGPGAPVGLASSAFLEKTRRVETKGCNFPS